MKNKTMTIPDTPLFKNAFKIVETLVENGFTSYYAGGCVRDLVLGKTPTDVDIATNAKPDDIINLFKNTVEIGRSFGVIIVILNKTKYDVAGFRKDNEYLDGRRPTSIEFSDEKEDVLRRDFTVNGLLYDPIENQIIDYVNGIDDINLKIIRSIGEPEKRFDEDYLRILRCIRFSHKLNFSIEEKTISAVKKFSDKITSISAERINDELSKIFNLPHPDTALKLLDETGLLKYILPELWELKTIKIKLNSDENNVFENILQMLEYLNIYSYELVMAILLHGTGKIKTTNNYEKKSYEISKKVCKRLKMSDKKSNLISNLILNHTFFNGIQNASLSTVKKFLRIDNFNMHLEFHRVFCLANGTSLENYNFCKEKIIDFNKNSIELNPKAFLTGDDLIKLFYKPGPVFKKILDELENLQLEYKINSKNEALLWVKENYSKDKLNDAF